MSKSWLRKAIVSGVLVLLVVVGAHAQAQDTTTNPNAQAVTTASGEPGAPAAASPLPAPRPRPLSLFGGDSALDLFVGYSWLNNGYPNACGDLCDGRFGLSGWAFSATWMFNKNFGLTADFSGHNGSPQQTFVGCDAPCTSTLDMDQDSYYFLFGPTVLEPIGKLRIFGHVLVGVNRADVNATESFGGSPFEPEGQIAMNTGFSAAVGGGVDYMFTSRWGWRIVQADYLFSDMNLCEVGDEACHGSVNNFRLSTGLLVHLGAKPPKPAPAAAAPPPNRPPVATCSIDRNSVFAASNDVVAINTTASDPDGDPLTYSWTATGGRVDGTGPAVRWLSAGTTPGTYTVTVTVSDGRGGTTTCSVRPAVAARPNRPPTVTLTSDRDTVFVGERVQFTARGADPDNDPLTYTWRTNCGRLTAANTSGTLDTTGVAPGTTCTVTVRVEDGRGGAADASKGVNVIAPPPPPQASKLSSCDFKPANSSRVDNVCKRILDDVGLRLQNEPRANVVVIGFAAPGAQAAKLAGDRAENTAKYLADKGVDRSRITTRTGAGQAGAGQENSRIDVIWVPEGATY